MKISPNPKTDPATQVQQPSYVYMYLHHTNNKAALSISSLCHWVCLPIIQIYVHFVLILALTKVDVLQRIKKTIHVILNIVTFGLLMSLYFECPQIQD